MQPFLTTGNIRKRSAEPSTDRQPRSHKSESQPFEGATRRFTLIGCWSSAHRVGRPGSQVHTPSGPSRLSAAALSLPDRPQAGLAWAGHAPRESAPAWARRSHGSTDAAEGPQPTSPGCCRALATRPRPYAGPSPCPCIAGGAGASARSHPPRTSPTSSPSAPGHAVARSRSLAKTPTSSSTTPTLPRHRVRSRWSNASRMAGSGRSSVSPRRTPLSH